MPALRAVVIAGLLVTGLTVNLPNVLIIDVLVTLFCLIFSWFLLQGSLRRLHAAGGDGDLPIREMARFAWHMAAVDLLGSTSSPGALRLALANALGVVESGLFAFLQSLERLVSRYLPGVLLRNIVRPMLVNRAFSSKGSAIITAGSGILFKSNLIIIMSGIVFIAIAGDEFVGLASGGKFTGAGLTLLLMLIGLSIKSNRSVIEMVMQITGQTAALRATALIPPIALVGVWFLVQYGLNFAILTIIAGSMLSNGIAITILRRSKIGFRLDWRGFASIVIPAVLLIALALALPLAQYSLVVAVVATVAFWGTLPFVKPFTADEFHMIKRGLGQRLGWIAGVMSRDPVPQD
jgi:hypothetical protein